MADKKITQLTETPTLEDSDLIPVVTNTDSTPENEVVTFGNLKAAAVEGVQVSASVDSSATPTPTAGARRSLYFVTALATTAVFGAPTGSLTNGDSLIIRIKDNGTRQTLEWNAVYRGDMPTTTIDGTLYVGFIYNTADSVWDCLAVKEVVT
jgi:hypothetical protein